MRCTNFTKKTDIKTFVMLHLLFMVYSLGSVCSKLAAGEKFLSIRFCLFYGMVLMLLGAYAVAWQQAIKRLPLTVAFANKAVTVVWGIIWGAAIFQEEVTFAKLLGAFFVIFGIALYSMDREAEHG